MVKKSIQVLRLSLAVIQPYQRTVTQKKADKIIEKLLLRIALQKQKHLEVIVCKTTLFGIKISFPVEKNFSVAALDGRQYCILKTNFSNDCCGRCNCADFTFFMIFFITEDFAKVPSTA